MAKPGALEAPPFAHHAGDVDGAGQHPPARQALTAEPRPCALDPLDLTAVAPLSPGVDPLAHTDDVLGHARIAREIAPIGVATGEACQNRVIFKQLLQAHAIRFLQVDSCRMAGVNEVLPVLLMAEKFGVAVCPHAGGVGLCEYVQHIAAFDYIAVSGTLENRVCEFVDHLHEHFVDPCRTRGSRYLLPEAPGYSITMKAESLDDHEFPAGRVWREEPVSA